MSFLPENMREQLVKAMEDGELSDELAEAIGADPDLLAAWEEYMRTDEIGILLERALAQEK
jgi:hypothetical protein